MRKIEYVDGPRLAYGLDRMGISVSDLRSETGDGLDLITSLIYDLYVQNQKLEKRINELDGEVGK